MPWLSVTVVMAWSVSAVAAVPVGADTPPAGSTFGDVAGLRALPYPDEETICFEAILSVPELKDRLEHLRLQLMDVWLAAAEHAIESNDSSFAVVPITELLAADGLLNRLRSRGYEVREP